MLKVESRLTKYGTTVRPRILNASVNSIIVLETILQNMVPNLNTLKRASTPSTRSLFNNTYSGASSSNLNPATLDNATQSSSSSSPSSSPSYPRRSITKHNSLTPLLSPPSLLGSLNSSSDLLLPPSRPSPSPSPPSLYSPLDVAHDDDTK